MPDEDNVYNNYTDEEEMKPQWGYKNRQKWGRSRSSRCYSELN